MSARRVKAQPRSRERTSLWSDCSKCGAAMPPLPLPTGRASVIDRLPMTITGYVCSECGHGNNLKGRKGFKS